MQSNMNCGYSSLCLKHGLSLLGCRRSLSNDRCRTIAVVFKLVKLNRSTKVGHLQSAASTGPWLGGQQQQVGDDDCSSERNAAQTSNTTRLNGTRSVCSCFLALATHPKNSLETTARRFEEEPRSGIFMFVGPQSNMEQHRRRLLATEQSLGPAVATARA